MPVLVGPIKFTGNIDGLVAYQMPNSDKVILRKKARISAKEYAMGKQYTAMRYNSAEFRGCVYASKQLQFALAYQKVLCDHNLPAALNGFCKTLQKMDTEGNWGERSIRFSAYKDTLTAIAFTKKHLFDSVIIQRPVAELLRDKGELRLKWSELLPGFNIKFPWEHPYFRIIVSLSVLRDVCNNNDDYQTVKYQNYLPIKAVFSPWMSASQKMPAQTMIVRFKENEYAEDPAITFIGAVGIQMGKPDLIGNILPVKYASTARILTAV